MKSKILNKIASEIYKLDKKSLVLRLTLIAFIFKPIGVSELVPILILLSGIGLVFTNVLKNKYFWAIYTTFSLAIVITNWPIADNHSFLFFYWNLTILLYLWFDEENILKSNSTLMIGIVFILAFIWKAFLSEDFISGEFMRFIVLSDDRFSSFTQTVLGLDKDLISLYHENKYGDHTIFNEAISQSVIPNRFYSITNFITYYSLVLELVIGILFLFPISKFLNKHKDCFLMLFCITVYAIATVQAFAWLLIVMGIAQRNKIDRTTIFYLATFLLIFIYSKYPLFKILSLFV